MIYFVLLWILACVVTYGLTLAYFQREFPTIAKKRYSSQVRLATIMAVGGPISLAVVFVLSEYGKHGLKFY